eukprot:c20033_g1_i1.p1 GENE.c20033_g1_i1~~c20033_g1_i1.p1  ORF type:complete len:544 (-),score=91.87 c20033_g1_i1:278-1873(-)
MKRVVESDEEGSPDHTRLTSSQARKRPRILPDSDQDEEVPPSIEPEDEGEREDERPPSPTEPQTRRSQRNSSRKLRVQEGLENLKRAKETGQRPLDTLSDFQEVEELSSEEDTFINDQESENESADSPVAKPADSPKNSHSEDDSAHSNHAVADHHCTEVVQVLSVAQNMGLCEQAEVSLLGMLTSHLSDSDDDAPRAVSRSLRSQLVRLGLSNWLVRSALQKLARPPRPFGTVLRTLFDKESVQAFIARPEVADQITPVMTANLRKLIGCDMAERLISCRYSASPQNIVLAQVLLLCRRFLEKREMGGQGQREKCIGLEVDDTRNETVFTSACLGNVETRRLRESELDEIEEWWLATSGKVQGVRIRTLQGYLKLQELQNLPDDELEAHAREIPTRLLANLDSDDEDYRPQTREKRKYRPEELLKMMQLLVCGLCQTWRNPPTRVVTVCGEEDIDNFNACAVCSDCIACAIDLIALVRSFAQFKGYSSLSEKQISNLMVLCARLLLFFGEQKDVLMSSRQAEFDPNQLFL